MPRARFASYEDAYDFLIGIVPKTSHDAFRGGSGLERIARFLSRLGDPQDKHTAIHIAGTSGKGTVSMMLTHTLMAHGFRVGTLMSPHAYDLRERIQIQGKNITKEDFLALVNSLSGPYEQYASEGEQLTYFELLIAMSYVYFAQNSLDYVVVETGMGGLLDATNTIQRRDKLAVITQIGLDHTEILGDTLKAIAAQKAGIITGDEAVVLYDKAVHDVFVERASLQHASLHCASGDSAPPDITQDLPRLNVQLIGAHQKQNFGVTYSALQILGQRDGWSVDSAKVRSGLSGVHLPGRMETVKIGEKLCVFDGAHNEQKLTAVTEALRERFPDATFGVVFASSRAATVPVLIQILKRFSPEIIGTKYHNETLDMLRPAADLSGVSGVHALESASQIADYIRVSSTSHWLITGSFYILAEVRQALERSSE